MATDKIIHFSMTKREID